MATCGIIGLGQLGQAAALYLADNGIEVIAIDRDAARVEPLKDRVAIAMSLDSTDERALRACGIAECATVLLALGENQLEEAVMTTMLLRELGVGRIISRASSDVQAKVLERLGVSRVIFPERQIGQQVARQIMMPEVHELVPLSEGLALAGVRVPDSLIGRTIGEAEVRRRYGLSVVALKSLHEEAKDDGRVEAIWRTDNNPGPETVMRAGDVLLVVGAENAVRELVRG
jgi:trk system potassium uptake protein